MDYTNKYIVRYNDNHDGLVAGDGSEKVCVKAVGNESVTDTYDTQEEAQAKADEMNASYPANNYVVVLDIPVVELPAPTIDTDDELAKVRAMLANQDRVVEANSRTIESLRSELAIARRHHRDDIALIGECLTEKAERHGWCGEYDETVDNLNSSLHVELPLRSRDYNVDITVTFTYTTTVTATDEDDATGKAEYDTHEALTTLRNLHDPEWEVQGAEVAR